MSYQTAFVLIVTLLVSACGSVPKSTTNIDNGCAILTTDDAWRKAFDQTFKKYGVPPHVVMAIIYQESRFVHDARPPKGDAYGYAQALDATWDWYRDKTGETGADRDHLPDAVDFIGWYVSLNHRRTGISKWDAKNQYLAYHDGTGGYLNKTHLQKPWLIAVADKVDRRARRYRSQLASCYRYPNL